MTIKLVSIKSFITLVLEFAHSYLFLRMIHLPGVNVVRISRLSGASDSQRTIAECMRGPQTLTDSWACALCHQTHFHRHVSSCSSQTPFSSSRGFYSWFCNGTCSVVLPQFVLTLHTLRTCSVVLPQFVLTLHTLRTCSVVLPQFVLTLHTLRTCSVVLPQFVLTLHTLRTCSVVLPQFVLTLHTLRTCSVVLPQFVLTLHTLRTCSVVLPQFVLTLHTLRTCSVVLPQFVLTLHTHRCSVSLPDTKER